MKILGKDVDVTNAYRSIGLQQAERYGIGFMDKSGVTVDMDHRAHPAYVMVIVLRGQGEYIDARGNRFHLNVGNCFQRFPNQIHTVTIDPNSRWLECFLEIGPGMFDILKKCTWMNAAKPVLEVVLNEQLIQRLVDLHRQFKQDSDRKLIRALPELLDLTLLLHDNETLTRTDGLDELIDKACNYLTADFQNPVDLPAFCRLHGWGYENFRKLFKEKMGVSPHRYRIRRRLDTACSLLAHPELSISQLAKQLGYSSAYEFSAQFKRYIGCPPSTYVTRRK